MLSVYTTFDLVPRIQYKDGRIIQSNKIRYINNIYDNSGKAKTLNHTS